MEMPVLISISDFKKFNFRNNKQVLDLIISPYDMDEYSPERANWLWLCGHIQSTYDMVYNHTGLYTTTSDGLEYWVLRIDPDRITVHGHLLIKELKRRLNTREGYTENWLDMDSVGRIQSEYAKHLWDNLYAESMRYQLLKMILGFNYYSVIDLHTLDYDTLVHLSLLNEEVLDGISTHCKSVLAYLDEKWFQEYIYSKARKE
jgi:hypothetical protein